MKNNFLKKYNTNQSAITLIALVITIAIMLILAGVVLNATLNGGLFGRTEEAIEEARGAQVEQQSLQWKKDSSRTSILAGPKNKTAEQKIEELYKNELLTDQNVIDLIGQTGLDYLKETGFSHSSPTFYKNNTTTIGTRTIDFRLTGELTGDNGNTTPPDTVLQVGDYVNYGNYITSDTYTTNTEETGRSSAQTFTTGANTKWRVLRVEGDNVILISENSLHGTTYNSGLYLQRSKRI